MCGITGFISWDKRASDEREILEKMTNTLSLRGPDATGYWLDGHVGFGHKRLSIIDLEGGKQPMRKESEHNKYVICYNGELYNTEELRKSLMQRGYTFTTSSDTEVLLTSYMEWKEDCVDHLNGIFAFAIWDEAAEKLFIARDRLGVKPLFYSEKGKTFVYGSEIKALLAHPQVRTNIDRTGLSEIFGLGPSRTPGHGLFKDVDELRAGHAMTVTRAGKKVWRYWNLESKEHKDSLEETAEKVRTLFVDSVERQLVSDVPVSTFLSGGLDSSAITAIAANHYKENVLGALPTFSLDYQGNKNHFQASKFQPSSDQKWIEKMVESFSTDHHEEVITGIELATLLKEAVEVRDQPGQADIDSSLLWCCRQIKQHTTVALSGECADEIFGGYPWFHDPEAAGDGFPWIRSLDGRIDLLHDDWKSKLKIEDYVRDRYQETIAETPRLDGESKVDAKRRELFYLNIQWFMSQLLDRKDRMSMGAGLEVRVPYADHHLVEYVWNIPWEMKMANGREKGILRKAMEGILPQEVLYRKKSPYPRTFQPEYTEQVSQWMRKILTDSEARIFEFLKKDKVEKIVESTGKEFKDPWYGQLMRGPQLIAHLCQIDYWLRKYDIKVSE
ncbi:asparagine synthase (glutamine-hydrolyzing) [Oceanobacillus sojae]|uniref:asparagine synthase (glutamine-hydrolyzing) n=1 Tax=Oceanobacillus sojae TaxID=582851 RepID=UPI0021A551C1|nr:asparagine synthase (glutamine-hydrolyzing) [Oceanobacillus sojae]MCT1902225.1 asparagine synthase (glutamine-hydrolyzing) [Oceanobacillus sojae]